MPSFRGYMTTRSCAALVAVAIIGMSGGAMAQQQRHGADAGRSGQSDTRGGGQSSRGAGGAGGAGDLGGVFRSLDDEAERASGAVARRTHPIRPCRHAAGGGRRLAEQPDRWLQARRGRHRQGNGTAGPPRRPTPARRLGRARVAAVPSPPPPVRAKEVARPAVRRRPKLVTAPARVPAPVVPADLPMPAKATRRIPIVRRGLAQIRRRTSRVVQMPTPASPRATRMATSTL